MVIELDRLAKQVRDAIVGNAETRGVSDLASPAVRSTPPTRASDGSPIADAAGVDDPDIRVSLSSAALRSAEVQSSREIGEAPPPPHASTPNRTASESTPRRHAIDAYRESLRAPRGERLEIVV